MQKNYAVQKDFQIINKDLTIVKSVKDFKKQRHDLYKWSQVVQIVNQLTLIFSVFFVIVSLIETLIQSPPFLVSVSAVSLSTRDLMPVKHKNLQLNTEFIYGLQIMNSLMMLSLAVVGIYLRSKLHLGAANLQMNLLIIFPALAAIMMSTDCVLSFLYLQKIYEENLR